MVTLVAAICEKLVSLPCVSVGQDSSALQQMEAGCVAQFTGDFRFVEVNGCAPEVAEAALVCFRDALGCPAGWAGEPLPIEEVMEPVELACDEQSEAISTCGADPSAVLSFNCETAVTPGAAVHADLDGDGVDDPLPPNVEDRRVGCTWQKEDPHLLVELPAILVDAGAVKFTCAYGTWTGPDMVIVGIRHGSDPISNHHLTVHALPDGEISALPDGEMFECGTQPHTPGPLLFHGLSSETGTIGSALKTGQRYYVERHSLNAHPTPILVNGIVWFDLKPPDSGIIVASPYLFGPNEIKIPPGDHHVKSTCVWPQDTSVLVLSPHIHELGTRYALDWVTKDGKTTRVLEVDPWEEEFVNEQVIEKIWEIGEFEVKEGDRFVTHCSWHNPTSEVITNPEEMCNSFGVAYPLDKPFDCDGDTVVIPD